MLTSEHHAAPVAAPPKHFVDWWHTHRDHTHGIPARVAYKCACYLEEYKAASLMAPLLNTAQPVPGAGRKATRSSRVQ
jgi:hypothetical protein